MLNQFRYGAISCALAVATTLIRFVPWDSIGSLFNDASLATQRWTVVMFLALTILPPVIGLLAGFIGLVLKDRSKILSIIGIILNLVNISYTLDITSRMV